MTTVKGGDVQVGEAIEWRDCTGQEWDGVLRGYGQNAAGEPVWLVDEVRKRMWMDDTNRENGKHETESRTGQREVNPKWVLESGPCSWPRGR